MPGTEPPLFKIGDERQAQQLIDETPKGDADHATLVRMLGNYISVDPGRAHEAEQAFRQVLKELPEDAATKTRLASILWDHLGKFEEAEILYLEAIEQVGRRNEVPLGNVVSLWLTLGHVEKAREGRRKLANLGGTGLHLIDAGIAVSSDNFGEATVHLKEALEGELTGGDIDFFDDLLRLLRLAKKRGYANRLLEWFEESRFSDRYAPVFAGYKAFLEGERKLLDFNPEVREAAQKVYAWLIATGPGIKPEQGIGRSTRRR